MIFEPNIYAKRAAISVCLMLVSGGPIFAGEGEAVKTIYRIYDPPSEINYLDVRDTPIKEVFNEFGRRRNVFFECDESVEHIRITEVFRRLTVKEASASILAKYDLQLFSLPNEHILVCKCSSWEDKMKEIDSSKKLEFKLRKLINDQIHPSVTPMKRLDPESNVLLGEHRHETRLGYDFGPFNDLRLSLLIKLNSNFDESVKRGLMDVGLSSLAVKTVNTVRGRLCIGDVAALSKLDFVELISLDE